MFDSRVYNLLHHFVLNSLQQEEITSTTAVCRDCWRSLANFHEFYVRIHGIHNKSIPNDIDVAKIESNHEIHAVWYEPKVEIDESDNDFDDADEHIASSL